MRSTRCERAPWLLGLSLALGVSLPFPSHASSDSVLFSFAFFGCNRLDSAGQSNVRSNSTANTAQLLQSFKDIAATSPPPLLLFMAGDIVDAKRSGDKALKKQLGAWKTQFNDALPKPTQTWVFTGNHELLMKDKKSGNEVPNPAAYTGWPQLMKDFIAAKPCSNSE